MDLFTAGFTSRVSSPRNSTFTGWNPSKLRRLNRSCHTARWTIEKVKQRLDLAASLVHVKWESLPSFNRAKLKRLLLNPDLRDVCLIIEHLLKLEQEGNENLQWNLARSQSFFATEVSERGKSAKFKTRSESAPFGINLAYGCKFRPMVAQAAAYTVF